MADAKVQLPKGNTCFSWSRLLLSASLPLVLGVFTIIFTMQQNSISNENRVQDRLHAIELRQQLIYDTYINDISKLLLRASFNRSDRQQLNYIGFKTVDVLQHLTSIQKRDIIFFLYNHELNRKNKSENQRVLLNGADLTDVHFIRSTSMNCDLHNVYLPSILAKNIIFDGCDLSGAVFDNAWMVGAKFIGSLMDSSEFYKANLTEATFHGGNINRINFSHSSLVNSKFSGLAPSQADFTNADLLYSDLTNRGLLTSKTLINTRFPNGSFSAVDSSQLIIDGGAESSVSFMFWFCK